MRRPSCTSAVSSILAIVLAFTHSVTAFRLIESDSLQNCGGANETGFTAQLFQVAFTPDNGSVAFQIDGVSAISGKIMAEVDFTAYGYKLPKQRVNPCDNIELKGFCPMVSGNFHLPLSNIPIGADAAKNIPGIAFTIPDLDGVVQLKLFGNNGDANQGKELACVEADLSNGKTVYQKAVGWSTAVIAGLALLTSAIVSGLGHSNTAAHIAAYAMSLFAFFQSQALFGMTAVPLPPIVAAWTQNFQWSLGIIRVDFIQSIATWYQRSTGGTPSNLLNHLTSTSINVQKRSVDTFEPIVSRAASYINSDIFKRSFGDTLIRRSLAEAVPVLQKRAGGAGTQPGSSRGTETVRGIERVGFKAGIEVTNIFMTGYIFFIFFIILVILTVVAFKWILEALAKSGKVKGDKFQDFRNGWTTVLKGIMYRLILIGFPQMVVLCFWELTRRDSGGEIALAVITVVTMIAMLAWVCAKVVLIARRSITMHKNPAYILYSDPVCLHKWGFLYVQYKAATYWFIIPYLAFLWVIGLFVAFGQPDHGIAQAIGFLILNCGFLIALCILRPYMDKKTNAFNIAIAAINFVSSIFLLFFTEIFDLPGLVVGIMGVLFFFVNAAFALILLILLLIATGFALFTKNPDVRYQPMSDDRGSFIKSQTNLTTELDALGATARGEPKGPVKPHEADADSYSSGSWDGGNQGYNAVGGAPYNKEVNTSYDSSPFAAHDRTASIRSDASRQRKQNNASPWQRGAGYDR